MSAPYSKDLRQKAIAAVERGEGKSDVSQMLNISRNTLDLWLKRKERTGNCRAITHYQQGFSVLAKFLQHNPFFHDGCNTSAK